MFYCDLSENHFVKECQLTRHEGIATPEDPCMFSMICLNNKQPEASGLLRVAAVQVLI